MASTRGQLISPGPARATAGSASRGSGRRRAGLMFFMALAVVAMPVASTGLTAASTESADVIISTVDDVLSRPAYTGVAENPISQLIGSNAVTQWITDQINRFIEWLAGLGGGDSTTPTTQADPERSSGLTLMLILGLLVAGIVAYIFVSRRDTQASTERLDGSESSVPEDELARLADMAEALGDFEQAVRLRFEAGLRALDRVGVIDASPVTITGTVRREVALDEFDVVANVFEVATYSDYEATEADADSARHGWEDVFRVLDRADGQEESP